MREQGRRQYASAASERRPEISYQIRGHTQIPHLCWHGPHRAETTGENISLSGEKERRRRKAFDMKKFSNFNL
eukprot:9262434-Pyramimonas_sp.AAC.1